MNFDANSSYALDGEGMQRLWRVCQRLYSEDRFKPDEMRDLAQEMHAMLERSCEICEFVPILDSH